MYKDKDDFEYDDFQDIDYYHEDRVRCPCCGDVKALEVERDVVESSSVELECLVCGCVFEVGFDIVFQPYVKNIELTGRRNEIRCSLSP